MASVTDVGVDRVVRVGGVGSDRQVATVFAYRQVGTETGTAETVTAKQVTKLCRTDLIKAEIQRVRRGGENNLHSHPHRDEVFFVLGGRVRFYTEGDVVVGELGNDEGIVVPRGFPYWFEAVGDEELELLQVAAADQPIAPDAHFGGRTNHAPRVGGRAEERPAAASTESEPVA